MEHIVNIDDAREELIAAARALLIANGALGIHIHWATRGDSWRTPSPIWRRRGL
ncbi:hypothetical protein ACFRAI_27125 [Streptomyces sp. NPDC056637]|uniref:hypothetical protein n=1 Tax=unclassified Streptomyces TaxID=2593676 RepID=UPI0036A9CF3B